MVSIGLAVVGCQSDRSPSRIGELVVEPDPVPASPFSHFGVVGDVKPVVAKRHLTRAVTNLHHCGYIENPLTLAVAINRRGDALDASASGDAPAFVQRCVGNLLRAMRYPGSKDGKPSFMAAVLEPTPKPAPKPPALPAPKPAAPPADSAPTKSSN